MLFNGLSNNIIECIFYEILACAALHVILAGLTAQLATPCQCVLSSGTKKDSVMDLSNLSFEELKTLQKQLDRAIKSFEGNRITAARAELEALAKELGVSLKDIVGANAAAKVKRPVAVRYRNPNNPLETWTGRGRTPLWLAHELTKVGKSLADFAV